MIERIAAEHGLRTRGGKLAIELNPPIRTDKGQDIKHLIRSHGLKSVIYLGDDVSDTDAFRAIRHIRGQDEVLGLSIGVMHEDAPTVLAACADILIPGADSVRSFLLLTM